MIGGYGLELVAKDWEKWWAVVRMVMNLQVL
jgi:hypothetical protein